VLVLLLLLLLLLLYLLLQVFFYFVIFHDIPHSWMFHTKGVGEQIERI